MVKPGKTEHDCIKHNGTDFPYNDAAITHREIEIIKNLGLNNETKNKILGGNLKKLLRLPHC